MFIQICVFSLIRLFRIKRASSVSDGDLKVLKKVNHLKQLCQALFYFEILIELPTLVQLLGHFV